MRYVVQRSVDPTSSFVFLLKEKYVLYIIISLFKRVAQNRDLVFDIRINNEMITTIGVDVVILYKKSLKLFNMMMNLDVPYDDWAICICAIDGYRRPAKFRGVSPEAFFCT